MEGRKRTIDEISQLYSGARPAELLVDREEDDEREEAGRNGTRNAEKQAPKLLQHPQENRHNEMMSHIHPAHLQNSYAMPIPDMHSILRNDPLANSTLHAILPHPQPLSEKLMIHLEDMFTQTFATVFPRHQIHLGFNEAAKALLKAFLISEKTRTTVMQQDSRCHPMVLTAPTQWTNHFLSKAGQDFCRALHSLPYELCRGFFCDKTVDISDVLLWYYRRLEENRAMYENIQGHHKTVSEVEWNKVVADNEALVTYKNAASAMGSKTWVLEANKWMADYCIRFFCQGGAARHYMKGHVPPSHPNPPEEGYWKKLNSTLITELCSKTSRIRLVDVGSCYNPLAKLPTADLFDITAFDLCPGDDSVLKGDFLDVGIVASTETPPRVQVEVTPSNERLIKALPAGCFDAVTMSLVLSYLPNPTIREALVMKAKRLLVSPEQKPHAPHHTGLLIIVEKQSILQLTDRRSRRGLSYLDRVAATVDVWKETITSMGFSLLAYQALPTSDGRKSHAFVFANTTAPPMLPTDRSLHSLNRLWIKQDSANTNSPIMVSGSHKNLL